MIFLIQLDLKCLKCELFEFALLQMTWDVIGAEMWSINTGYDLRFCRAFL